MKTKKVVLRGVYNLNGSHLPFEHNPLHGKTYNNVEVSFSKKICGTGDHKYVVDVVNIEGCEPIKCELVSHYEEPDGTLVISICQDWG